MPAPMPFKDRDLLIASSDILSLNRVQAWPKPLNGAGLIQNLHQVADDVTAKVRVQKTKERNKQLVTDETGSKSIN